MNSFLLSKWTADDGKRSKIEAQYEDKMSGKGSNESPGRLDTRNKQVTIVLSSSSATFQQELLQRESHDGSGQ